MKESHPRWHDGLILGPVLGLILLTLSYIRTAADAVSSMVFSNQLFPLMLDGPVWGTALGNNLLRFATGVLLLHLMIGFSCWLLGQLSARAWPSRKTSTRQHVLLWFVFSTLGLLAYNSAVFVMSSLGQPYSRFMSHGIVGTTLGQLVWTIVLVAAGVTAAIGGWRWWHERHRTIGGTSIALVTLGIGLAALFVHSAPRAQSPAANAPGKPNVILIGFDSLRADLLDPQLSPGATPHLAAFMGAGTRFSNAMTPLARTFPSMCTMLTGRRPHKTGAVMNLLPRHLIDDSESLPRVLAREGYVTAYATDEVRFSNIDESYGFAQVITPPIGASDFLIPKIGDTPVTNLIINTRLGSWLFPHLHANRGAANTYDPDTFVSRIDRELTSAKPLFLNIHLTLGHWPYRWAGSPAAPRNDEARWPKYYLDAARRADEQFADLLEVLHEHRLLENAIVIAYSDHGESFESPDEALVPDGDPLIQALRLEPTWGHGTTVLTAHQYRIVFGIHRYGGNWEPGRHLDVPVSFEDIAPTIVEAVGAKTSAQYDGSSLLPVLESRDAAEQAFRGRVRFTETEFHAPGIADQDGEVSASKVYETLSLYDLDRKTDRLTVKPRLLGKLLSGRQFAAVGDQFIVGAFPSAEGPGSDFLAVPLAGGAPRPLIGEPGAEEPELRKLWEALHEEFGALLHEREPGVAKVAVAKPQRTITPSVTK